MVNLPEGKMKSREGTVVDGDDLINSLRDGALGRFRRRGARRRWAHPADVAEKVALGALHYFLLQTTPTKDMIFNPKESLSFNGNTGPTFSTWGARISSILRKAEGSAAVSGAIKPELLAHEAEWELLKTLAAFPREATRAAEGHDPSAVAAYLSEVSKCFSPFYHDCPILSADSADLARTRLELVRATRIVPQERDGAHTGPLPRNDVRGG
jgi:arginyl-tRNA synthetase